MHTEVKQLYAGKMIPKSETHTCVLSTGKLTDFDLAETALKDNKIPFYKQTRSSTGLVEAMPHFFKKILEKIKNKPKFLVFSVFLLFCGYASMNSNFYVL